MFVFVYGTLRRGMERNHLLGRSTFAGTGTITALLFDCGPYPGARQGGGTVYGELYEIDRQTLEILDQVEGFQPDRPGDSLFIRRLVTVSRADGGSARAFCYFFNRPTTNLCRISHGDYVRHRHPESATG